MEAFFSWLLQNIAWDTLKKSLPKTKHRDLAIMKAALGDAQARMRELDEDRRLLEKLVKQRNRAIAELMEAKRRIAELERELRKAKRSKKP